MDAFSEADIQILLDVEVALAVAEAEAGVIPASCVDEIRAAARAEYFDAAALTEAAVAAGNVVIPLVRELRARVAAASHDAARFVHHGATSQDILDTAVVLRLHQNGQQLRESLSQTMTVAAALARAHASTPMAGRTWLQHASPITFGLKAAGWLDATGRVRLALDDALQRVAVVQLGGAAGTLASLGDAGPRVLAAFAGELSLGVPDIPWHTHRDRFVNVAMALGLICGALGKVGRDLVLLAQSEVREAYSQPVPGQGISSAMPHKQNPVRAVAAVAASLRAPGLVAAMLAAMPQEHERAAGGWQAEWSTLPDLVHVTSDAATAIATALGQLQVDALQMRNNLHLDGGVGMSEALVVALGDALARDEAIALVESLCRAAQQQNRPLAEVATEHAEVRRCLSPDQIHSVLRPEHYLGSSAVFIERVLRRWQV